MYAGPSKEDALKSLAEYEFPYGETGYRYIQIWEDGKFVDTIEIKQEDQKSAKDDSKRMTQQELGITETGWQFIEAIIARGEVERKIEWYRLISAVGASNLMQKPLEDAEAMVRYWQEKSREEYDEVMKQRGWYRHEK